MFSDFLQNIEAFVMVSLSSTFLRLLFMFTEATLTEVDSHVALEPVKRCQ